MLIKCSTCDNLLSNAYIIINKIEQPTITLNIDLSDTACVHLTLPYLNLHDIVNDHNIFTVCINCLNVLTIKDVHITNLSDEAYELFFHVPHITYALNMLTYPNTSNYKRVIRLSTLYYERTKLNKHMDPFNKFRITHIEQLQELYKKLWSINLNELSTIELMNLNKYIVLSKVK